MALLPEPLFTIAEDGSKVRFANGRWLKYITQLNRFNEQQVDAFGLYLCREAAKLNVSRQIPEYDVELVARAENVDETITLEEPQSVQRQFDCA